MDDGNFSHLDISSSVDEIPSNLGISVTFEDTPEQFGIENENSTEKDSISDRPTDMRGWMLKSGVSFMSSWKRRYFVQSSNKLNYHIHPDDITPKGYIDLGQSYEIKPTRVGFDIITTQVLHLSHLIFLSSFTHPFLYWRIYIYKANLSPEDRYQR